MAIAQLHSLNRAGRQDFMGTGKCGVSASGKIKVVSDLGVDFQPKAEQDPRGIHKSTWHTALHRHPEGTSLEVPRLKKKELISEEESCHASGCGSIKAVATCVDVAATIVLCAPRLLLLQVTLLVLLLFL